MAKLPPLNSIRVFEVVARRSSFKLASEELCVTQSAVSQQIRQLEDSIGYDLFIRKHNAIKLSHEGKILLPAITKALCEISQVFEQLDRGERKISVFTTPSFASGWLMPLFHKFEEKHPEISVQIGTGVPTDKQGKYFDFDIVYSKTKPAHTDCALLAEEWLVPVCSKDYASCKIKKRQELSGVRILLNSPDGADWKQWAGINGIKETQFEKMLNNSIGMATDAGAIDMAISGHGIALANLNYVASQITNGTLQVAIPSTPLQLGAHFLIYKSSMSNKPLRSFMNWIKDEAQIGRLNLHQLLNSSQFDVATNQIPFSEISSMPRD